MHNKRADYTLDVCLLPGRPRRAEDLLDVHDGNLLTKGLAVNAVAITQQILRCGFERESFQNLSRRPFRSRMCGHVKVHEPAAIMLDHDKDEKNLEEGSRNREEVDGDELLRVIIQERPPRL